MLPNRQQCLVLFDKYNLPSQKRVHVEMVTKLALFFADKLIAKGILVNRNLIESAALLHDIDHEVKKLPNERHPDAAVRIINELGFPEIAEVVKKHSLHTILDPNLKPKTWEEKLVYLADKMTKYEVIGVDHRFAMWRRENLPPEALDELIKAYPKVKQLEATIYQICEVSFEEISREMSE
jgi:HD superfamily phosphodiesterase